MLRHRWLLFVLFFILGAFLICSSAAEAGQNAAESGGVSPELADYVQSARKLGLRDTEVRLNALKAGWKPESVDAALKTSAGPPPSVSTQPSGSAPALVAVESVEKPERPDRGVSEQYVIGEADVLQVTVWKEPDVSVPSVVVRADGKITLPLIKDVVVSSLTPAKVEALVTEKLKPFYNDPDVSVVVREVHSKRIYLVGAVRKQGVVELRYPMTVLQAITEAGGPTDFAKRKKIYLLRTQNGKQFRFNFNYDEVAQGKAEEQNLWVAPGDYIFVPQ